MSGNMRWSVSTLTVVSFVSERDTQYDGNDFALSDQSCGANEKVLGINAAGQVVCGQDIDTQNVYSGNDFTLSDQSCGANEKVLGINAAGQVVCGQDVPERVFGQ